MKVTAQIHHDQSMSIDAALAVVLVGVPENGQR
jgi:hypothetical protein